jgi:hypothetical protein
MANLTTLEKLVRLAVPGANLQVISSSDLWVYINKGAQDVNQRLKVRRKNFQFTDPAFTSGGNPAQDFSLASILPDFVCMDDSGLYYQNGALWQQLLPKDRKWLDENVYSWRNFQNGAPLYYIQENDDLAIIPPPATVYSPSYWIYYIQQVVQMSNGNQFPFTGATIETPSYNCLDDGIVNYCQWKLMALLGNKAQGVMDQQTYLAELEKVEEIFVRRPDMTASRYYKMQGPVNSSSGR